jgi:hypothetical protein
VDRIATLTTDWNGDLVIAWIQIDSPEAAIRLSADYVTKGIS